MSENLGIPNYHPLYIMVNEEQDRFLEFLNISYFLNSFKLDFAKLNGLFPDDLKICFINYGSTELVYVLEIQNKKRFVLLVNQPVVGKKTVLDEAKNLIELQRKNSNIVAPIQIYQNDEYVLCVTPYIPYARCIATNEEDWGMYIPEPTYRFVPFKENQREIVLTCMIAKLVGAFNVETKTGISDCQIAGNDFMLDQDWEKQSSFTISSTIQRLYLISARKLIHCSLEEYITLIRKEFSQKSNPSFVINKKRDFSLTQDEITNGISIGLEMLKQKYNILCEDGKK